MCSKAARLPRAMPRALEQVSGEELLRQRPSRGVRHAVGGRERRVGRSDQSRARHSLPTALHVVPRFLVTYCYIQYHWTTGTTLPVPVPGTLDRKLRSPSLRMAAMAAATPSTPPAGVTGRRTVPRCAPTRQRGTNLSFICCCGCLAIVACWAVLDRLVWPVTVQDAQSRVSELPRLNVLSAHRAYGKRVRALWRAALSASPQVPDDPSQARGRV